MNAEFAGLRSTEKSVDYSRDITILRHSRIYYLWLGQFQTFLATFLHSHIYYLVLIFRLLLKLHK